MVLTLSRPPRREMHRSTRSPVAKLGVSHVTVHRIRWDHRIQSHRSSIFKLSTDPQLVEKVTDVVGLLECPGICFLYITTSWDIGCHYPVAAKSMRMCGSASIGVNSLRELRRMWTRVLPTLR